TDERLLPVVVGRDEVLMRLRDLDVVAEDLVVADLERGDARPFALRRLELREPALPVDGDAPELVDLGVARGADVAGDPRMRRRRVDERRADLAGALGQRIERSGRLGERGNA